MGLVRATVIECEWGNGTPAQLAKDYAEHRIAHMWEDSASERFANCTELQQEAIGDAFDLLVVTIIDERRR
jgi:hypothetical protein